MNSKDVHANFPDQMLREYFAEQMIVAERNINAILPKSASYDKNDPHEYAIQTSKNQIKFHQERIGGYKILQAITRLMKEHGWSEWDVSDYTTRVGEHWYPFIGTEKEYNTIMTKFTSDEKDA